jgi:peptide-methionine (S)-S-oxide reductase
MMKRIFLFTLLLFIQVNSYAENKTAIFAGGCFWCMEKPYDEIDGVISTISGYTGGHTDNPTYEQTSNGNTGHYEALKVTYDSNKVSYEKLLEVFWANIDPFDANGQFCDKGPQYRSGIFTNNENEKNLALNSKISLQNRVNATVVTEVLPEKQFYPAEEYHQDYYIKNPIRYKYYRYGCGRDKRLDEIKELFEQN